MRGGTAGLDMCVWTPHTLGKEGAVWCLCIGSSLQTGAIDVITPSLIDGVLPNPLTLCAVCCAAADSLDSLTVLEEVCEAPLSCLELVDVLRGDTRHTLVTDDQRPTHTTTITAEEEYEGHWSSSSSSRRR